MILRLLTTLALTASAAAAGHRPPNASRQVRAGGAGPNAAEAKCRPALRPSLGLNGFRLGMTAPQVVKRFPEFPDLARFLTAGKSLEWKDASGALAISGGGGDFGLSALSFEGRYIKRRMPRGELTGEFQMLALVFLDGRLVDVGVRDWVSPEVENVDGLKAWVERRYDLTGLAWDIIVQEKPPGITYFDFQTNRHTIDCDRFSITASCVGPPAPPNICNLAFRDPSARKIVEARRAAASKRGRKK